MNTHDPASLTPEERALAQHLSRLGPHGEPSPALDAAVLAAAHAANAVPAPMTRRRWPVALGVAASLALAVGIAWQLRPLPQAVVYDEAASTDTGAGSAPAEVAGAGADAAAVAATARDAVVAAPPAEERPAAPPEPQAGRVAKSVAPAPPTRPAVAAQRVQAAPPVPAPTTGTAAMGTAAPAPAPPPPPRAAPAPESAATTGAGAGVRAAPPATTRDAAGNAAEDAFVEDVPPATADSPEVREAWLQRIRELARAGDTDAARASLDAFMHRHPDHPVPDDLRALIE